MFGETALFTSGVVMMLMLSTVKMQQVIPSQYITTQSVGMPSANGSSPTGNCSPNATSSMNSSVINVRVSITTCTAPASSVLFDGIIPTLTGLDGNMWASQLLTLYRPQSSKAVVNFDFSNTEDYAGVGRVEVVIVNCPDMGITVNDIYLTSPTELKHSNNEAIPGSRSTPMNASCNSLVTVNLPCTNSSCNKSLLGMEFRTHSNSNLVYIAEIRFCCAKKICPAFPSIFTDDEDESPTISSTTTSPPNPTTNTTSLPPPGSTITTSTPNTSIGLPTILSAVGLSLLFIILVCVVAVVLLLWRCYCAKHHKHNTTALGEGTHASPHTHSHPPPITLCEETGQALYSVVQDEVGGDSHYSRLQHDTNRVRGGDMIYEADTAIDQLYAQVDKKKRKKKGAIATNSPALDTNTAVDQLYAQVDKKESKGKDASATTPHPSETDTAVDQLYAPVKKKKHKKKSKEVKENFAVESEALYSVVNKPRTPQLPTKSDLLMEDENEAPPLPPQSDLLMED